MDLMKNPEIRRTLCVCTPICLLFTGVAVFLNAQAGLLTGVLCLVLLLVFLLDAHRRYATMARLVEDIDAVLHGRQEIRFAHYTEGEVSLLRSELKKMTVRLMEQTEQLKDEKIRLAESIADISHQMRTPLTTVNLLLAGLSDAKPEEEQKNIFCLRQQVQRLDWLVNSLLKFARLDAGTVRFQPEHVTLESLIERAAQPLSILMELKEQTLHVQAKGAVVCDPLWTAEALGNILKNCTEHMHGGSIFVTAEENAVCSVLRVRDTGSGIAPQDLPHLFERYYKGTNAAEQSTGIGLALSRAIVCAQNGTLTAANYPGGAEFVIKLYKSVV